MIHLIDRGVDVNLHILEFYSWSPSTWSTYPKVLAALIRNGLTNLNTSCPVSLSSILMCEALPKGKQSGRLCGKVGLLLKHLHKLGASCQMTPQQRKTEQHNLPQRKKQVMPEAHLHQIIADGKNIIPCRRHEALTKASMSSHSSNSRDGTHYNSPTSIVLFQKVVTHFQRNTHWYTQATAKSEISPFEIVR